MIVPSKLQPELKAKLAVFFESSSRRPCRRRRLSRPEQRLGLGPFATRGNRTYSTRIKGSHVASKQVPTKFQEACQEGKGLRLSDRVPRCLHICKVTMRSAEKEGKGLRLSDRVPRCLHICRVTMRSAEKRRCG
jgi:hypothetical protein